MIKELNKIKFFNYIVNNSKLPSFTIKVLDSLNLEFFNTG